MLAMTMQRGADTQEDLEAIADSITAVISIKTTRPEVLRQLAAESDVDLPFLAASMPEAIDRVVVGIGRVTEIVRSIKAFAHPDQAAHADANLNQAIETTITIARGEYK